MFLRLSYCRHIRSCQFRSFSTSVGFDILNPYPNYVERQLDVTLNTATGEEVVVIDRETTVKVPSPATFVRATINYVDTNPLGDKNQPLVLLVHGYPGTHASTRNLIEEFQRRNFRCIAPDMPYCGKTKMPLWSSILWRNSVYLRARFLGEFLKHIMGNKLIPIHTVVGCHENAYALMSMIDQYEYFRCKSLIMIDPTPRKLIRFFPLAKFVFDFGRLPLHWPVAKFLLKILGYRELLLHSQRDILAAIRIWMMEDTSQYDAHTHNFWLSRLHTMIIVSRDDKHLNNKMLDALIKDLAAVSFNKSNSENTVVKRYSCDHNELLTDRINHVGNDIEKFLSATLMSPAATIAQLSLSTTDAAAKTKDERKEFLKRDERTKVDIALDQHTYNRASANDFFSNAFGSTKAELKPNQPHSLRSTFEHIAGGFVERRLPGAQKETLADVKEQLRKRKIRIDTKN